MQELHEKALEQLESMPLDKIPQQIIVKVIGQQFKNNSSGKRSAYLYLKTTENLMITQMYPQSSWKELEETIGKAGGLEYLKSVFAPWKKRQYGKLRFDRLFPEPKPREKKA